MSKNSYVVYKRVVLSSFVNAAVGLCIDYGRNENTSTLANRNTPFDSYRVVVSCLGLYCCIFLLYGELRTDPSILSLRCAFSSKGRMYADAFSR